MGVAAGVGGQARRDKSEIGAVTRFRDMFHKFGKKFQSALAAACFKNAKHQLTPNTKNTKSPIF